MNFTMWQGGGEKGGWVGEGGRGRGRGAVYTTRNGKICMKTASKTQPIVFC